MNIRYQVIEAALRVMCSMPEAERNSEEIADRFNLSAIETDILVDDYEASLDLAAEMQEYNS